MNSLRSAFKLTLGLILLLAWSTSGTAQAAKPPVEVPFEFEHNQIILQVKMAGKGPFNMLLDTDTDPSANRRGDGARAGSDRRSQRRDRHRWRHGKEHGLPGPSAERRDRYRCGQRHRCRDC